MRVAFAPRPLLVTAQGPHLAACEKRAGILPAMRTLLRACALLALGAATGAHEDHARVLAELGRRAAAEPRAARWELERAALLRHVGRDAAAIAAARRALALSAPGSEAGRAARLELARSLAGSGARAGAERALAAALRADPTAPELHALAAELALARGADGTALGALDRALRWSERPTPDLVLARARVARRVDPEEAVRGLEAALERFGRVPAFVAELDLARASRAEGFR